MEFVKWHYSKGVNYYINSWTNSVSWIAHFFSLSLLIKTLFSPWKRLVTIDTSPGFDLQKKFEMITFNFISVGIGIIVRFMLFWIGLLFILFAYVGGGIGFFMWLFLPFFSYGIYRKWKKQPGNFVKDLIAKTKNSKNPLNIIFASDAGQFVLNHTGLDKDDLVGNADSGKINLEVQFDNFTAITSALVNAAVWKEEFFNKREMKKDDLVLAASWWDKKRSEETGLIKSTFGRPGIGLSLTFGYTPTLDKYSTDLSYPLSYSHRLIGRFDIVSRMERILTSGSSVLLIGQPGVGKKTVVLEFAKRAANGELGKDMAYKRVLEFDYNSLLSSATDVNAKKNQLALSFAEAAAAGNIVLMIKDIHRLTNPEVEGYDYTDVIEGHLEKKELKIIAVSTNVEYERFIAPNLRLRKFLEKVEVIPPTRDEAMEIIIEAAQRWEINSRIVIPIPVLRYVLDQSDRYETEVPFPEKALELLDAVMTYCAQKSKSSVSFDDTNAVLAEKTGISFARLGKEEKTKLSNIEEIIHGRLVDQESSVSLIGKTLRAKTVGIVKEDRPLGSFLFLGPTGVGKTETAKVLAKVYYGSEEHIIRFDMAEYSGGEGMERLIGSVSKNVPGALTTAIKNRPASILLLDEIEKATKDIYNLFLALLDEGVITDAFEKRILARHLFVIGTSNAGAEFIRGLVSKGITGEELQKQVVNYVLEKEIFSPEFLNRFDGVVVYEPLRPQDLIKIAGLILGDLKENLKKKNIFLEYDSSITEKLARDGYDPAFGARPMKRIVNLILGDLLGQAILKGEIAEGDTVRILAGNSKEDFKLEKIQSSQIN